VKARVITQYRRVQVYLENTLWVISEKLFQMGLSVLVIILLARYLGPEQFGILSYGLSVISIFAMAGHVGLSGLVVRELVKNPDRQEEVLGTSIVLKGIGYFIGFLLLLVFAFISEPEYSIGFWVLIILSFSILFRPIDVIDFWFQSRLEAKFTAISKMIALLVSSLLTIALVFSEVELVLFTLPIVIQSILTAILLLVFYKYKSVIGGGKWCFSSTKAKELIKQGVLVFLGSIFAVVYLKVDQVMLKWMVGVEEVGIYSVASTLSEAWYFLPVAIVSSLFPKLINLRESNPLMYKARLQQIFDLLFLIAMVIATIVSFVADPLIEYLFGKAFHDSGEVLVIHIWAAVFIFMRAAFSKWILIENVLIFSLITQGLGAMSNIILNWFFIPTYGAVGAAYATLISYAVSSYLALIFYSRTREVFVMMSLAILSPLRYLTVVRKLG